MNQRVPDPANRSTYLRMRAEIEGVPGRRVDPMKLNDSLSAAEAKRQRKMAKRAKHRPP